jgi:catechol 2,3-dioxygenase-like lactoylglutathione lyase family enzyme
MRLSRSRAECKSRNQMNIQLVTLVVNDYDTAIAFFVGTLGFDLVEDVPAVSKSGQPKRWVVVRPPGAQTGLLLARADGDKQIAVVGNQTGGRVAMFLRVDDFDATFRAMKAAGASFIEQPRTENYGRVAVFEDPMGNRWDLLGS